MGSGRLRCLRSELCRLHLQHSGFLLHVDALFLATFLVGGTLALVVLPVHVVDVDDLAVRIQVEDAIDGVFYELDIMADHNESPLEILQEFPKPGNGVGIQVVSGLIEQHGVGSGEQNPCEFDAPTLTTRKRRERLVEDAVWQAQIARNGRGFGLRRISTQRHETVLQLAVLLHRPRGDLFVGVPHFERRLVHADHQLAEAASIEDARASEILRISRAWILGKVADFTGRIDGASGGEFLASEHLRQCCLSRAVPADEADLVAAFDSEGDVLHEHACANTQFEVVHAEHRQSPIVFVISRRREGGGEPLVYFLAVRPASCWRDSGVRARPAAG